MIWRFFTVAQIKERQVTSINAYGGSHGLRDAGLLESAVLRAANRAAYDPDASVANVAAALARGFDQELRLHRREQILEEAFTAWVERNLARI